MLLIIFLLCGKNYICRKSDDMSEQEIAMNPNDLVRYLGKSPETFTRADLISFIEYRQIRMVNFRYVAGDGKLKTLNFIINSREHLENILTFGERVDGSSLFPFINAGSSDLYVLPRYRTAFVNPFSEIPSLEILCSFIDHTGKPLDNAPEYILQKAARQFREDTGMNLKAFGELEYYVNSPLDDHYIAEDQKGYHISSPFSKWEDLRVRALELIARTGGKVKYGHSEVGNFTRDGQAFEQHEIEFLPMDIEQAAEQLVIAKWILRRLANEHGIELSFAPKITVGKAGSGLHIHLMLEKDGNNFMLEGNELSVAAKKMISGILSLAPALTAFGNTIPTSYLRLVPNQEAPTRICWGERNRSVLVRVPLGWSSREGMANMVNPAEKEIAPAAGGRQTVEFRAPDGSADVYNLLAGLLVAARKGILDPEGLAKADKLHVNSDIFHSPEAMKDLDSLPTSCFASATALEVSRSAFEEKGIFPEGHIDAVIHRLRSYRDSQLSEQLEGKFDEIRELVLKFIHVM